MCLASFHLCGCHKMDECISHTVEDRPLGHYGHYEHKRLHIHTSTHTHIHFSTPVSVPVLFHPLINISAISIIDRRILRTQMYQNHSDISLLELKHQYFTHCLFVERLKGWKVPLCFALLCCCTKLWKWKTYTSRSLSFFSVTLNIQFDTRGVRSHYLHFLSHWATLSFLPPFRPLHHSCSSLSTSLHPFKVISQEDEL